MHTQLEGHVVSNHVDSKGHRHALLDNGVIVDCEKCLEPGTTIVFDPMTTPTIQESIAAIMASDRSTESWMMAPPTVP